MISRVFHEQSESMLVGPRSLFIVLKLNLVLAIFSVIKINAVNAQTVGPETKSKFACSIPILGSLLPSSYDLPFTDFKL